MGLAVDAVVVGSGAGGAAAVWQLTQQGLRVLLLEAGPRFDPRRDYPLDSAGWERRGFPVLPFSRGEMGWLPPSPDGIAMCQGRGVQRHAKRRTAR